MTVIRSSDTGDEMDSSTAHLTETPPVGHGPWHNTSSGHLSRSPLTEACRRS
ncbi:hypothetical protein GCM10017600_17200 [Streptosporangium carneum]|uniref:Uncharacterized protein n=1 Tax=Streptosporangium carneum TaxID=47481 RepID=A0A9W6HZP9_9ACTN|nr:hypothetical protein GCM10017600_17200 [Streptosporangium carneum]